MLVAAAVALAAPFAASAAAAVVAAAAGQLNHPYFAFFCGSSSVQKSSVFCPPSA